MIVVSCNYHLMKKLSPVYTWSRNLFWGSPHRSRATGASCQAHPGLGTRSLKKMEHHVQFVLTFIQFIILVIVTHRITSRHLNLVLQKLLQINIILAKIYFRGLPNFGNLFWWRVGVSLDVNWGVRLVGLTLLLLFCNESLEDLINPLLCLSVTCPDVWEIKAMS